MWDVSEGDFIWMYNSSQNFFFLHLWNWNPCPFYEFKDFEGDHVRFSLGKIFLFLFSIFDPKRLDFTTTWWCFFLEENVCLPSSGKADQAILVHVPSVERSCGRILKFEVKLDDKSVFFAATCLVLVGFFFSGREISQNKFKSRKQISSMPKPTGKNQGNSLGTKWYAGARKHPLQNRRQTDAR